MIRRLLIYFLANFTLPRVGPLLNEVKFIEENEEESTKIVAEYKRKARSSNDRGSNSYRRRDHGQKGSSRFHPYKRDDQRSNRGGGGGGNRDRRSGGRGGGGGSNYGRQHGGSSHDRRSGGGYNKGNQNYSKGGNRSGGNRGGGGNFQKNFQYQQQQQQQQRYTSYAAAPQYR